MNTTPVRSAPATAPSSLSEEADGVANARRRRFVVGLVLITVAAFAIRMAYAYFAKWDLRIWGDALYYHYQANGLADGHGFQIFLPFGADRIAAAGPSADHPPLFPVYLAVWSFFGASSWHWHMFATVLLGTATVFVCGLVGREIGGDRVGLITAAIAAVYASLWVHDPLVMSEPIAMLLTALAVLLAYRFWKSPSVWRAIALGAVSGLAALTRPELALFVVLCAVPLALLARAFDVRRRLWFVAAICITAGLVVAPWIARNLLEFEHPVLLSGQLDIGLAATNCDAAYYGDALGWWSQGCLFEGQPSGDPSEQAKFWRAQAVDYVRTHTRRVPVVLVARFGRVWELYHPGSPWGELHPDQKIKLDLSDGREARGSAWPARIALAQWFVFAPLAIVGGVLLWRRRITIIPMLALVAIVSLSAVALYGNTRFRTPAEIVVVALAAIALDGGWRRFRGPRAAPAASLPSPSPGDGDGDLPRPHADELAGRP